MNKRHDDMRKLLNMIHKLSKMRDELISNDRHALKIHLGDRELWGLTPGTSYYQNVVQELLRAYNNLITDFEEDLKLIDDEHPNINS